MRFTTKAARLTLAAAAALLLGGLLAPSAGAAKAAKLEGTFAIKGKVTDAEDASTIGAKVIRTYKFKCKDKACKTVQLFREGSNGHITKSILKRKRGGVYEGVED
ncbi:MAG: hypothetical protein M9964_13220 [Solirubrobacterales bacterium]|nr:hypothetical protein [Thermoleophilales bacterium]MCO5327992.1 hypothetical protein [Solirubrobacterales bacterium]